MGSRTIGQLAKAAGVAVDTVRYNERIGLLPRRGRAATGWRRYLEETLVRLQYVREGRAERAWKARSNDRNARSASPIAA